MSGPPARRPHWIPANHGAGLPTRHVYLDTETTAEDGAGGQVLRWRLGVATADVRTAERAEWRGLGSVRADTPADLWAWISAQAPAKGKMIAWAHNLGFDLRTSDALRQLPALGWSLERIRLSPRDTVASFRRDRARLILTDLHAWVPTSLAQVGVMLGKAKVKLPTPQADREAWFRRCERDVEILQDAVHALQRWHLEAEPGNWQPTGAGQAWANWRHNHYTHRVLVHSEPVASEAERASTMAGRAEVWRHGRYPATRLHELDWPTAYAQVCRDVELPSKLLGAMRAPKLAAVLRHADTHRVLCQGVAETERPVVPARVDDRVAWPVGRFSTHLWDCELAELLAAGGTFTPTRAWVYRRGPVLRSWASWALEQLTAPDSAVPPIVRAMIKQQTRTLVGRFGLRFVQWTPFGQAPPGVASLGKVGLPGGGEVADLLNVGDELLVSAGSKDGVNAFPGLLACVMAEVRARLWRWMNAAGLDQVFYVDTDGMLVTPAGKRALGAAFPDVLREKAVFTSATLRGPRQLTLGGRMRTAGVPVNAADEGDGRWRFEVWEGLGAALSRGRADSVLVRDRVVSIRGVDHRRTHLDGGFTAARRVTITEGSDRNGWVDLESGS